MELTDHENVQMSVLSPDICLVADNISDYPRTLQQSIIAGYILNNYTDCYDDYRDRCDWQVSIVNEHSIVIEHMPPITRMVFDSISVCI